MVNCNDGTDSGWPVKRLDSHASPVSKAFGIGIYWDDVDEHIYPADEVEKIRKQAYEARARHEAEEREEERRNEQERKDMPALYPYLKPVENYDYANTKRNIAAYLKHHFPKTKFSLRKIDYSGIAITWTDGAAEHDVENVRIFKDHCSDFTGDYYDFDPSNFNRVFGGMAYVWVDRELGSEVNKALESRFDYIRAKYGSELFYKVRGRILGHVEIPSNASNFRLVEDENASEFSANRFRLEFDLPEKQS